ncbi:MAG: Mut7-C RNAse domain-containing protein [Elusimicrobia bacterium]|nr:Mut7-C RNAse domain-containing protein [Elusimicrobiota bacterium]
MKFLVDRMCGRLARWLRLLGYDAKYVDRKKGVPDIIYESLREQRIILTRNRRLSARRGYRVYYVKTDDFFSQIKEVAENFGIKANEEKLFSRCINCNGEIVEAKKDEVKDFVPSFVFQTTEKFYKCLACGKIYWKGSHIALAKKILSRM